MNALKSINWLKARDILEKNLPTILMVSGVSGFVSTVVLAVKATPKAQMLIELDRYANIEAGNPDELMKPLTTAEIVKRTWKCYIPTVVVGSASIACVVAANSIHIREKAALAGLYAMTENLMREYQQKVIETIGERKEEKIHEDIAQDRLANNPVKGSEVYVTGKGETLCYDSWSGRYFKSDIEKIRKIQNDFNRDVVHDGYKSLNEFYWELGLESVTSGENMGWHIDYGLLDIKFSAKLTTEGEPCVVLEYRVGPRGL